jgi:hypothetical protein
VKASARHNPCGTAAPGCLPCLCRSPERSRGGSRRVQRPRCIGPLRGRDESARVGTLTSCPVQDKQIRSKSLSFRRASEARQEESAVRQERMTRGCPSLPRPRQEKSPQRSSGRMGILTSCPAPEGESIDQEPKESRAAATRNVRFPTRPEQSTIFRWVEPGLPGSDCAARCPWHPSPFADSKFRR